MLSALKNRKQLTRFTEDPRLPIDNNAAERAIRRVAIGRNYVEFPVMLRHVEVAV